MRTNDNGDTRRRASGLTFQVKQVDATTQALEQSHVDENTGGVKFDVTRVLGAVVCVVPFVGRQQQLHQSVRHVGLGQCRVVTRIESDAGDGLKNEAQQVLKWPPNGKKYI
jgi:hypothetical protein